MPDLTIKAGKLEALANALMAVLPLTPPATPKGRYALARAHNAVAPCAALFADQKRHLLEKHAKRDEQGQPVIEDLGNGAYAYDLGLGIGRTTPAFDADFAALKDEDVTVSGVRAITHAELGACPITAAQESVLLGLFIVDEEPE